MKTLEMIVKPQEKRKNKKSKETRQRFISLSRKRNPEMHSLQ